MPSLLPASIRLLWACVFVAGLALTACDAPSQPLPEPTATPVIEATPETVDPASLYEALVPVDLIDTFRLETYPVSGKTANELRRSLNRNSPATSDGGRHFDALTTWSLRWNLQYEQPPSGCALAGATILLDIVVKLPELETPDRLPPATLASWQNYRDALQAHEMVHVGLQRQGAIALQQTLANYNGLWPNCIELGAALKQEGEAQVRAIIEADEAFDEHTDHGRLEGASFP